MADHVAATPRRFERNARIAIIGGGFSGTMQAINLLRHDGPGAVLIERREDRVGRGVAYSAAHPDHLLNVRAGNMSAFPDEPQHFVQWLAQASRGGATSFVSRTVYGEYLNEMLAQAVGRAGDRLRVLHGSAVGIERRADGLDVLLADGARLRADAVVLAMGNLPPHPPAGFDERTLPPAIYARDPWAGDIAEGLSREDVVLLLGTGLTAIDAALLLDARGFAGRIVAISRRGLVPHAHWNRPRDAAELLDRPPARASALVRFMRERAAARGWRDAVDDLRPVTQRLWGAADAGARERFLRHLRPYWDIHRHRLAPQVAARIEAMRAEGRLVFMAGKTIAYAPHGAGAELVWRRRGATARETLRVSRAVNCTGPQGDLLRTTEPLLTALLDSGAIRPDRLRLGLDVDAQSHVIGRDGIANDRMFAIGPMTRGGLWEVVAVPDIRHQTWTLARRLANAQWVGGEGL